MKDILLGVLFFLDSPLDLVSSLGISFPVREYAPMSPRSVELSSEDDDDDDEEQNDDESDDDDSDDEDSDDDDQEDDEDSDDDDESDDDDDDVEGEIGGGLNV